MKRKFPGIKISRSTLHTMQRKVLRYSYKRITTYRPYKIANKTLKRIMFVKKFLETLKDPTKIMIVIDEVGFGKPLRNYGYSVIGEPLVYKFRKKLNNITCTASISENGIELLRFFYEGGTTTEYFKQYFDKLLKEMKLKYPEKGLVFVLDNLWAHKSTYIMKIMQD